VQAREGSQVYSPKRDKALKETQPANADLWVVIPANHLTRSKQRLQSCLGRSRAGFSRAMLEDVLDALGASRVVSRVIVVSRDPDVLGLAEARGCQAAGESGAHGMNPAVAQGLEAAREAGARWLVVVPLDIPLLTVEEFDRLALECISRAAATPGPLLGVVPSADLGGTNWICLPADAPFVPAYGPNSYRRHLAQAEAAGQQTLALRSPLVSLDIDRPADLNAFLAFCRSHPEFQARRTWQFLQRVGQTGCPAPTPVAHPSDESKYVCS